LNALKTTGMQPVFCVIFWHIFALVKLPMRTYQVSVLV
jgi:hypothetical protein